LRASHERGNECDCAGAPLVVWFLQDGKLDLLTVEGVSRWLEEHVADGILDIESAAIKDALRHDLRDSSMIMARDQSVYEAAEVFAAAITQGRPRLYAIIITNTGKATEDALGIITPWDLLQLDRSDR
jgi:hypothetical protein